MNKRELINRVALKTGGDKDVTATTIETALATIAEELAQGGRVQLVGFGCFMAKHRRARTGINPHTQERVDVPAKVVPKFEPGKGLKDAVSRCMAKNVK